MKTLKKSQYELIAGIIKADKDKFKSEALYNLAVFNYCDKLSSQDPKFDRNKFLEACGVERETKECDFCGNNSVVHFQNGNGTCENCGEEER